MFTSLADSHVHIIRDATALPPLSPLGYDYLIAGNGVFVRAENRLLSARIQIASCQIRGLARLSPVVVSRFSRLPGMLLARILHDARCVRDADGTLCESFYQVRLVDGCWHVCKPAQIATATSVTTIGAASSSANILLDIHSHGNMPAFFSAQDDADELGLRIYGVLGQIGETDPTTRLRLGIYGYYCPLPLSAVFTAEGLPHIIDESAASSHAHHAPVLPTAALPAIPL